MNNKIILAIVIIAVLAIAGYFFYSSQPIVSAQGESSLKAQPDEISVYLNIEAKNATLQDAQKTNSEITDSTVSALNSLGINQKDIQLLGYTSYPWTEWNSNTNTNTDKGFVVSQQIIVKTTDFNQTSKIVNAALNNGALVQTIQMELSPASQNQYKTEALKEASANAKDKAASIAEGQGRKLGSLVSVQSNDFNYMPRPYYAMMDGVSAGASAAEAKQAAANISPSDLDVTASITVEYKLSLF